MAIAWLKSEKLRFSTIRSSFGQFLAISSLVLKITGCKRFIFSGTLAHSNIFRLKFFRAFSVAWFNQNQLLIELNSPISALHFSFATVFHYVKFVRFCWNFKDKLPYRCSFWMVKPVCWHFFHLRELGMQTLGTF